MKLLLVDDDPELRRMYSQAFESWGYEVTQAENGKIAFDLLSKGQYDTTLADVMMPVCDGMQLLANLKQNNTLENGGRIILMSNLSDKEMEKKANTYGVYKTISKVENTPLSIKAHIES